MENKGSRTISFLWLSAPFILLLSLLLSSYQAAFKNNIAALAIPILLDCLLVIPVIYFLIIRKSKVPKTTIIPVLILGVLLAGFILPQEHQYGLNFLKTYALPLLEIGVLLYVIIQIRRAVKKFNLQGHSTTDFYGILKGICKDLFPKPLAHPLAMEIAVGYFGFITWKKPVLQQNEFSYHKNTGSLPILGTFIFLILVETIALHLLLVKTNVAVAWILTGLSLYTAFQIFGIVKSVPRLPIQVNHNELILRYGIVNEVNISYSNIETVEANTASVVDEEDSLYLSPLGKMEGHNIMVRLLHPAVVIGPYGIEKKTKTIKIFVDEPIPFIKVIEDRTSA